MIVLIIASISQYYNIINFSWCGWSEPAVKVRPVAPVPTVERKTVHWGSLEKVVTALRRSSRELEPEICTDLVPRCFNTEAIMFTTSGNWEKMTNLLVGSWLSVKSISLNRALNLLLR